jgi:hypothetical protein
MSTVNEINPKIDLTVKVFDAFYQFEADVPANEYDAVYAYFRSQFDTVDAAKNFTTVFFLISSNNGIPVMELLDEIRRLDAPSLTVTLAYYLNGLRSGATLLGVQQTITPNIYAARNVLQ